MIPANAVDLARMRRLLDIAEDHLKEATFDLYMHDGYVHFVVTIKNAPEAADVLQIPIEELLGVTR